MSKAKKPVFTLDNLHVVTGVEAGTNNMAGIIMLNALEEREILIDRMLEVLARHNMSDAAPERPSRRRALTLAVDPVRNVHRSADRLGGAIFGYQVTEKATDSDTAIGYTPQFSVYLDPNSGQFSATQSAPLVDEIAARYERNFNYWPLDTVKVWARRLLEQLGAVKLIDKGYVYYVAPSAVQHARQIGEVLREAGACEMHILSVGNDIDTVRAVTEGLTTEIDLLLAAVARQSFDSSGQCSLTERTLATQKSRLQELLTKVQKYESILGVSLSTMVDKIDKMSQGLVLTTLAAQPADDVFLDAANTTIDY